jgi:uncharacterized Zn finger protein
MSRERWRIESKCPECGCGLIEKMTPDQWVAKYGESVVEADVTCPDCGKVHKAGVHKDEEKK